MISEGETFSLVYLKAMAKRCFAVGSRNKGVDGIIKDREHINIIKGLNSLLTDQKFKSYFKLKR